MKKFIHKIKDKCQNKSKHNEILPARNLYVTIEGIISYQCRG